MTLPEPVPGLERRPDGPLLDRYARRHTYLRISVTDRCNYRCVYCMPKEGLDWLPREQVLSYEEITRIAAAFAGMGVTRIRLTGGEPTVRKGLEQLVASLAAIPGIDDLAMTTNGHVFAGRAAAFARAGLKRVNISIDSVDPKQFAELTRGGDLARVLAAIDAARAAGLTPIKLNCVVVAGTNDDQVEALLERFAPHAADTIVRFIEYMPFGKADARNHLPVAQIRARLDARYGLDADRDRPIGGGPSVYARLRTTGQRVGFISPITEHFCQSCNRLRLQADGHLRTCLSRDDTPSLRDLLRNGLDDAGLAAALREFVWGKVAGHEAHLVSNWRAFEGVMTRIGG